MSRWPCIFIYNQTREADDHIQAAWKARYGIGAPFGSLRKEWRAAHCRVINPYGSERCPYASDQCIAAFEDAVLASLGPAIIDPRVYFISVAHTSGITRADDKPLARDRITPEAAEGPGVVGVVGAGNRPRRARDLGPDRGQAREQLPVRFMAEDGEGYLRRPLSRPVRIGELLRPTDGRPRQGAADDGEAGAK